MATRKTRTGPQALQRLARITEGGYTGLARRLGVSRQTVSAWASRRTEPTVASVRLMARRLGVSASLWTKREAQRRAGQRRAA